MQKKCLLKLMKKKYRINQTCCLIAQNKYWNQSWRIKNKIKKKMCCNCQKKKRNKLRIKLELWLLNIYKKISNDRNCK